MAIVNTFTHYIAIAPDFYGTFPDPPGEPITWTSGGDNDGEFSVDSRDNGLLDANTDTDFLFDSTFPYTGYVVEVEGQTYAVFRNTTSDVLFIPYNKEEVDLAPFFESTPGGTSAYIPNNAVVTNCFATGTRIATPDGDKPIEMLRAGDLVLTHDGRAVPVIWRAWQSVVNPRNLSVGRSPVRIEAGALGPDLPNGPLTVMGDHALLFDDMLINAGTLVNGTTIRLLPLAGLPSMFNYWHVELEKHECVVANGVPAESFIDYVGRSGFDNYDEYLALAGADRLIPEMPFARISAHRLVPPDLREALGIAPPSYRPRRMVTADMTRIFQIGFNKCGTRSIKVFFKGHGLETAQWKQGDLAKSIKADLAAGATPLQDWPDVNVFLDMEFVHPVHMIEGYKYFRELQAHYPDALFILNTRNGEAWIRSRNAHGKGSYTNAYRRFYGYDGIEQVFDRWRRDWHEHHAAVLSHFSGALSERLFVWDIDRPDFDALQKRVPFTLRTGLWTHQGKT